MVKLVFQKITVFNQDALSLTTGEELKCGDKLNVFSALRKEFARWKMILDKSGHKCTSNILIQRNYQQNLNIDFCIAVNEKIEKEVEEYENTYRGKELPGFINYKTFEAMVKEQIKQLEEPAVKRLKDAGGI